ncbi:hypothetical protein Cs7R123_07360 [Catellatospora sp. TT07R-123]|uniref:phosphatase PAP2 family protein n=1 Tax=Catellatospora sp. TT07R-123 TaxID=2733863 RepID=UPI001B13BC24|nr:phosphatase PAP2 family protein [Catellatospora sp. TT07R-123]GHJ43394.1 hypothetical protein Cs7R123_07360 [Catellatospora sp. TT07R-123]
MLANVAGAGAAAVLIALAYLTTLAATPVLRGARTRWTRTVTTPTWPARRIPTPLLLLATAATLLLTLTLTFAEIAEGVLERDDLTVVDDPVTHWAVTHRTGPLNILATGITDLGSAASLIILLTVVAVTVAVRRRSMRPVLLAVAVGAGIQLLVALIKITISRPRPDPLDWLVTAGGYSFPSGHSGSSIACFGMLAWLVAMATDNRRIQATAWLSAAALACAVGLSRIYLGVHYLSDVIGGWTLGAAWLTTVALAAMLVRARRERRAAVARPEGRMGATLT